MISGSKSGSETGKSSVSDVNWDYTAQETKHDPTHLWCQGSTGPLPYTGTSGGPAEKSCAPGRA